MQAITTLPSWRNGYLPGRLIIDVANEPSIFGIKWNRTNDYNGFTFPSWPDLYTSTVQVHSACSMLMCSLCSWLVNRL